MGGQEAIRGYLLQTIICVLNAFNEDNDWKAVALEPNIESEKVDIIWYYSNPTKIQVDQVKSSKNQINKPHIKKWSKELEESIKADEYNLILIGPYSNEVSKTEKEGNVVLKKKSLDIDGLISEAAYNLGNYMENKDYKPLTSYTGKLVVKSLITQFEIYSTGGKEISRNDFDAMLFNWISDIAPESIKKKIFDILTSKGFITYKNWSEFKNIAKPRKFIKDEQRTQIIEEIRETLVNPNDETQIIRIVGLPGIGKRRLVFEILSNPELNKNAYLINSKDFKDSNMINKIISDKELELMLIVGECNLTDHIEYVETLGNQGSRIAIITISENIDTDMKKPYNYLLKNLSTENIKAILSNTYKGLPDYLVQRICEFSEGFPRFAIDLADRFEESPSEYNNIIELTDKYLLDKFIAGKLDINSPKFEKIKRVLMGIAIFKKVGYKDRLLAQAKWVCSEISKVEWEEFQSIVREQRDRGLLEGNYYLRINPFLLETYLYCEWWETYGNFETLKEFQDFINRFPVHLDVYFYDSFFYDVFISRFKYINHTSPGNDLIQKMLSSGSILNDKEIINQKKYINLMCNLVESNIDQGINFLKNMLNSWSNEDLSRFIEGRNEVLWLLQKLAFREEYFEAAAFLLLRLAETHPIRPPYENFFQPLNDSIEFFAEIFSAMWGETPPDKKYEILVKMFNVSPLSRRAIVLYGFRRSLTTTSTWNGCVESLGNLPPPNIWKGTWVEIYQYHIKNWKFLFGLVKNSEEHQRLEIVNILNSSSRGLLSQNFPELKEIIRKSFEELGFNDWIDKLELLAKVSSIIRFEGKNFPDDELFRWIQLKESLRTRDFKDELKIFLSWVDIDLIDLNSKYEDQTQIKMKLKKLAKEIKINPFLLQEDLEFLNSKKIFKGFEFGKLLGELDEDFSLKDCILDFFKNSLRASENMLSQEYIRIFFEGDLSLIDDYFELRFNSLNKISIDFIAGYLSVLYEKNVKECEELITDLSKIEFCQYFIPEIIRQACPNDNMIELIMQLITNRAISKESLNGYRFFGYPRDISEEKFKKWIKFLVEELPNKGFDSILTSIFYYYRIFGGDKQLPKKIILKVLKLPFYQKTLHNILDFDERMHQDHHISYYKEIAKKLVEQYPETAEDVFEMIIEFNMRNSSYLSPFTNAFNEVLTFITKNYSNEVWKKIEKILELKKGSKFLSIRYWLRKEDRGSTNLELFDKQNIINWVKEDIENRAKIIADVIPTKRFNAQDTISRVILEIFGDREDVKKAFTHNFINGRIHTYLPEKTNPYQVDKEWLLEIYENEDNDNIKKWIIGYIENYLEHDIERARTQKERIGRFGF